MANKRIDQLNPNLENLNGSELIPIFDTSTNTTERITFNQLFSFIDTQLDLLGSNKWFIPSGTTITVSRNNQNFIYGDLYVEGVLNLEEDSQLVVLNGDIILSGGVISGDGTTLLVELPEVNTYTTGTRLEGNILYFNRTDENDAYYVDLTKFLFTGNTASTNINNIYVSNLRSISELTLHGKIKQNGNNVSGIGNNIALGNNSTANGNTSFVYSTNSTVSGTRSVVLGGQNINGSVNDTVYVPNLNINTTPSTNNSLPSVLVRDSDGSIKLRQASSITNSVNYANVYFIDNTNGNNFTGQVNDFTKPYSSIEYLIGEGQSVLPTFNVNNRALIYVRRGIYFPNSLNLYGWLLLRDYVDIYFEPGVELRGNFTILDNNNYFVNPGTNVVNCNIYGHAIFDNRTSFVNNPAFLIKGPGSNINIECKEIKARGYALSIDNLTTKSSVFIDCDEIYADTAGFGFVINTRNRANVKINARKKIYSPHRIFYFRNYFDGSFVVNTPETVLTSGGPFGNSLKNILMMEGSTNGAEIEINSNFKNDSNATAGGSASTIYLSKAVTGLCDAKIRVNGDIVNLWDKSFWLQGPTDFLYRGIAKSLLGNVITDSGSKCTFLNSFISKTKDTVDGTSYNNYTFWLETASTTYFINSQLYNNLSGSTVLWLNTNNNDLYLYNSQLIIKNYSGYTIDAISVGNNLVCNNVITNAPYNNIYEATTVTGTTVDIKYNLPNI
jgi:hypothetical protein